MKAITYKKYGPPSVLLTQQVARPKVANNQVLIKVHYTTMNRTDTGYRSAVYFVSRFFTGLLKPKKQVTGTEYSGEVIEVGKDVTNFKMGDRVFGFDDVNFGAHAEYVAKDTYGPIAKIPNQLSFKQMAAAGEGATYALNNIRAAKVKSGANVLIYGASGAIGSAAVQICKAYGANVVAVCGTKTKTTVKKLGADDVIDYQTQDFTDTKQRFDFIFDSVGKTSYGACKKLLKPNGTYISTELGKGGQNIFLALWFKLIRQRKVLFPIPKITQKKLKEIARLAANGSYLPFIDTTYKIEDAVRAATYVETGQKVGNVLLKV